MRLPILQKFVLTLLISLAIFLPSKNNGVEAVIFTDVYGFLSAIFNDAAGISNLLSGGNKPNRGSIRFWVKGSTQDESYFPIFNVYGQNKNNIGSTKCGTTSAGDTAKIKIGYGKYSYCDVSIDEDPYYVKMTASPFGYLAVSSISITYNSGGGSNDDLFSVLLTGDNLNQCAGDVAAMDNSVLSYAGNEFWNKKGAWFCNSQSRDDHPMTVTFPLYGVNSYSRKRWGNCGLFRFTTGKQCFADFHKCVLQPEFSGW